MFQGDTSHLPLKLNTAGVIPAIFASSLLLLPATAQAFAGNQNLPTWATTIIASLQHGQPLFMVFYGLISASSPSLYGDRLQSEGHCTNLKNMAASFRHPSG